MNTKFSKNHANSWWQTRTKNLRAIETAQPMKVMAKRKKYRTPTVSGYYAPNKWDKNKNIQLRRLSPPSKDMKEAHLLARMAMSGTCGMKVWSHMLSPNSVHPYTWGTLNKKITPRYYTVTKPFCISHLLPVPWFVISLADSTSGERQNWNMPMETVRAS